VCLPNCREASKAAQAWPSGCLAAQKSGRALCESLVRQALRFFAAAQHGMLIWEYTQRELKEALMED